MFDPGSFDLSGAQWIVLALSAFLVGVSKTGIPGLSILPVPLMALVLPAKASVGVLLPMLIFADLFAAGYYRRHAQWPHILRLMPATLLGIIAGYLAMGKVTDQQLKPVIGAIVLIMLTIRVVNDRLKKPQAETEPSAGLFFAVFLGFFIGVTTMMANAAGPVMIIYLLTAHLGKTQFVGTAAWFFFIVNWLKVPFSARLDLITAESLRLNAFLFPVIFAGAVAGIVLLKHIPQKFFRIIVLALATAAAVKLLF
ncbi:MAG: sulfite exporter TauE/SafE family protein [Planctomycetota bacterium]|jgi:uncharacterized membrane protein YfcA